MTHNLPNEHLPVDEPTSQAIANLLRDFGEHPSKEFHTRHANAPWVRAATPQRRANWYWRGMLMAGLMLLLWFSLPSGFVAALDEFFGLYRAPSDTVEAPQGPIMTAPTVATLEEASALAGFDIRMPSQLPANAQQSTISVMGEDSNKMVRIDYLNSEGYLFFSLSATRGAFFIQIGASANVEIVQVGSVSGEYVKGGFLVNEVTGVSEWDSSFPSQTLRWQIGDISYSLSSSHLSKQALIDLAAGME